MVTRFSFVSLTSEAGATTNTRAAATLTALDIPLDKERTFTSARGDGIQGMKITWHFAEKCPKGNSSALMLKAWSDPQWESEHPDCPLVNCKKAFLRSADLTLFAKGKFALKLPGPAAGYLLETQNAKKSAAMERLGHKIIGTRLIDGKWRFQFHPAAASDFALWDDPKTHVRLPDALISYLWCAFDNHRVMVDVIKQQGAQFAAVQHNGRTAFVGKDMDQKAINGLEKLLYRR